MAGANGRALTIDWDGTTLVGVRTKGYTITNDYVDVTTDDDDGWRTLLADPGLRSVEVTAGGISSDQVILAEIMTANITGETLTVQLPTTNGTLAGDFLCSSFEQSGEHDGPVEFSATFMSNGEVTYTAGGVIP
jgi:TP901-1 family phage major tail protein